MPVVFPPDASPASRAPSAASERTESACFESALALSSPPPHPAESKARATIRAVRLHELAVRIGVRRFFRAGSLRKRRPPRGEAHWTPRPVARLLAACYPLGTIVPNSPSASWLRPAVKNSVFGPAPGVAGAKRSPHNPSITIGPPLGVLTRPWNS